MFGKPPPAIDCDGYMLHLTIAWFVSWPERIIPRHLVGLPFILFFGRPFSFRSCTIVLHSPHANMFDEDDRASQRVLQAARLILDSVHSLCATSFDLLLLPRTVIAMWKSAAGVLLRFYCVARLHRKEDAASLYRSDVNVFRWVLFFFPVFVSVPLAI
jgi:hypothetical protein